MNADRVLIEWDWVVVGNGKRLHYPVNVNWDEETLGYGWTACGLSGDQMIPGIFTRLGAVRCHSCCISLGFPQGIGSPKNDPACRPLVEQRLAEIGQPDPTTSEVD